MQLIPGTMNLLHSPSSGRNWGLNDSGEKEHSFSAGLSLDVLHACSVTQLCLTLCDPMSCSLPGSSVHEILQARILGWVAMPSSKGSSQPRDRIHISISCTGK